MEPEGPEGSVLCSQEPATGPYPEINQSRDGIYAELVLSWTTKTKKYMDQ
jgi:hypothetical protein